MALVDMLRDDDPNATEAGSKGTKPSQSTKGAGPAGKATVGKAAPYNKKTATKDIVSPVGTTRGQAKSGKASGIKAPAAPKNVTPKDTKRGK
jgi:hypothetical protein